MATKTDIKPGDVLALHTPGNWRTPQWWIRIGAALRDKPNLSNHIAVAHHYDAHGTLWGIEGRPGGVGWVDCTRYLTSKSMITNAAQPKTDAQRKGVCQTMNSLLGTGYDWEAIVMDGAADLGVKVPGWKPEWGKEVPAHVVCSAVAQYGYVRNGLKCPPGDRLCQPADWDYFIINQGWI